MSTPPDPVPPLHGLVLSGGRSSRMGEDKGLLVYRDGLPQVEAAARLLDAVCSPVYASARAGQWTTPPAAHRPLLVDRYENIGPLAGILTAFDMDPSSAWLVVACDLPLLDAETLARLVAARDPAAPATAYASAEGLPEPLCAIYEPAFRAVLQRAIEAGQHCPRGIMKRNPVKLLPLARAHALDNANDPQEAARLKARIHAMKKITVHYFGILREQAGRAEESCETPATTCAELFAELAARHQFSMPMASCRPAVNHAVARPESPIADGDQVVFLPPVAGG